MMSSAKELISRSFYRLLGSIVRLALRNGLTHKEFSAITKQLYVRISAEEYGLQGRQTNMARIALMTGLDRKEIKKIMGLIEEHYETPAAPERMAKILTAWHEDPRYIDNNKQPLEISIAGPAPSFEHLVKSHGGDIAAVTVLREFQRSQTLSKHATRDSVQVHKSYYVPNYRGDDNKPPELVNPEAITQGSSMLVDHVNTIFHNLYRDDLAIPREKIDLRATNIAIRKDAVDEFYQLVDRKSMAFLEQIDLWLSEHEVADPSEESQRLGIGLYFIEGENDSFPKHKD
jgi:hypothetical protein